MSEEVLEYLDKNMDKMEYCSVTYKEGDNCRNIVIKSEPAQEPDTSSIADSMFLYIETKYGYTKDELLVKSRKTEKVMFRYIVATVLRQYNYDSFTLSNCGKEVGLDHSMVIHAQKTVNIALTSKDPYYHTFRDIYNEIYNLFGPKEGQRRFK